MLDFFRAPPEPERLPPNEQRADEQLQQAEQAVEALREGRFDEVRARLRLMEKSK